MNKFLLYLILYLVGFFFSCKQNKSINPIKSSYHFTLKQTNKTLSYKLDEETTYMLFNISINEDETGKEYFSFRNYEQNQILIYNLQEEEVLFKVNFDHEGVDGIPPISGFQMEDFNNIYIACYGLDAILKADTTGKILNKYPFGTTPDGYKIGEGPFLNSWPYTPLTIINSKLYFTQYPFTAPAPKTPLTVFIDTLDNSCGSIPVTFPPSITDDKVRGYSTIFYSREFNGKDFIYSFYHDEDIYISSIDSEKPVLKKIKVKSKYLNKVPFLKLDGNIQTIARRDLEVPRYGDLIYDKYRDVYYRFAYHEVELDQKVNWFKRSFFGRKKFSVIILDKNFNIIGETLFPEAIYNSFVFFVHKDGLYISDNYQINYDQPEDIASFVCFELVNEE